MPEVIKKEYAKTAISEWEQQIVGDAFNRVIKESYSSPSFINRSFVPVLTSGIVAPMLTFTNDEGLLSGERAAFEKFNECVEEAGGGSNAYQAYEAYKPLVEKYIFHFSR